MSLTFQIPWLVVALAAVLCVAISIFVYRYTTPSAPPGKRYLFVALRSASLILLVFAICEPLFRLSHRFVERPAVAVLVDNSLSMTLTDDAGDRREGLRSLLSARSFRDLGAQFDIHLYSFSNSLNEAGVDSLHFNGTSTNIAGALRSLGRNSPPTMKAVLLVTDGNYNAGENPLYESERFGVPVYTVGIGDSLEQKDVLVQKILTNSVAYMNSDVPLDATIKVTGFEDRKLAVVLTEEGKEIDRQFVQVPAAQSGATGQYPAHFSFKPSSVGVKKYTVNVSALEGELTKKNNSKSALVRVLNNKMRVAVIAGAPSADVSAILQTLKMDPNVDAALLMQKSDGTLSGQQVGQITSASFDCLIIVGFPTSVTAPGTLKALSTSLETQPTPLMFIASRTIDLQKLRVLGAFLPFTVSSDHIDEQSVFPNVAQRQQFHILLRAGEDQTFEWTKLPPVFSSLATFKAKPEALVFATTRIQGVPIDNPLLVMRNAPRAKSFAVLVYGIWRWKLMGGANAETERFFDSWMSNVVRWLVTREDNNQLRVEPSKEIFSQGEAVDFLGQAYDATYLPIDNANIAVEVSPLTGGQRYQTVLHPAEHGRYEGEVESLPEGDYSYSAVGTAGGADIGKTTGRFSVGEQSIEYADTRMNKPLLQQIAAVSGGNYVDAADVDRLFRDLALQPSMKPEEKLKTSEFELWNLPTLLSVIVTLFGVEWYVRKRSGML